jgi:hypothetical protein
VANAGTFLYGKRVLRSSGALVSLPLLRKRRIHQEKSRDYLSAPFASIFLQSAPVFRPPNRRIIDAGFNYL